MFNVIILDLRTSPVKAHTQQLGVNTVRVQMRAIWRDNMQHDLSFRVCDTVTDNFGVVSLKDFRVVT